MIHIYTLADPRTNLVRYVGKSNNPRRRYTNHLNKKDGPHTRNWIGQLKALGLKPIQELLDECTENTWQDSEQYWIEQLRQWGFNLTNIHKGGGGYNGKKGSTPWNKGKKLSEETRKRMSEADRDHSWKKGQKQPAETVQKRISRMSGVDHANAKLTRAQVLEIRSTKLGPSAISKLYKISTNAVWRIRTFKTYK